MDWERQRETEGQRQRERTQDSTERVERREQGRESTLATFLFPSCCIWDILSYFTELLNPNEMKRRVGVHVLPWYYITQFCSIMRNI